MGEVGREDLGGGRDLIGEVGLVGGVGGTVGGDGGVAGAAHGDWPTPEREEESEGGRNSS